GVTVGSVTGKLKVNCRNAVNSSIYNYDGAIASIPTSGVNTGTVLDWWDTIDDYNNNVAFPAPYSKQDAPEDWDPDEHYCGDDNWEDVSVPGDIMYQDKLSGLTWTSDQGTGSWPTALNNCNALNASNYGGFASGWRLPTQKEWMQAYTNGIWSQKTQLSLSESYYWSSSSRSDYTSSAWLVHLHNGFTTSGVKTGTSHRVLCIR